MKKSKKKSRKEKINYFLNEAKYYNNAGQYKKAIANINLAYSVWEGYKHWDTEKGQKMLQKIIEKRDIIVNNYVVEKERKIYAMINC